MEKKLVLVALTESTSKWRFCKVVRVINSGSIEIRSELGAGFLELTGTAPKGTQITLPDDTTVQFEQYKWTDKNDEEHYSNKIILG